MYLFGSGDVRAMVGFGQWSGNGRAMVGRWSGDGRAMVVRQNRLYVYTPSEYGNSSLSIKEAQHTPMTRGSAD